MLIGRLLLIHNAYKHAGGEDNVLAAERTMLRTYGHDVLEYVDHNDRIDEMAAMTAAINTVWSTSSKTALYRILENVNPHVAHFHNTFLMISPSAYYACKEAGVPVVQTLHNYRLLCPKATFFRQGDVCEDCLNRTPPWPSVLHSCYRDSALQTLVVAAMLTYHRWLRTWKRQVDVFIALTEFAKRRFVEGGLPVDKIMVKPNFVYPDPGERKEEANYVLYVGRLSAEKGVRTLLRAWRNLEGIPLKVVGDGPLLDELRQSSEVRGREEIELLGRLPHKHVIQLMKKARLVVFPSEWYEGFPLVIAEAFACGVPVCASKLGGMTEIVADAYTGLHFEPGNPLDLASKIDWAWTHPRTIVKMGRNARREYEKKYTAERNYELLIRIYECAMKTV